MMAYINALHEAAEMLCIAFVFQDWQILPEMCTVT